MNRREFMERLENLLQNIPEQERVEAIQYYNDYFDDAGEENEQAVLDALGTPAQVAENIKRDLNQNRYGFDCEQEKVAHDKEIVKYQPEIEKVPPQAGSKKSGMSAGIIVLIVVLCILAAPVLIGLLMALLGIVVAIFAVWIAMVASVGSIAIALLIAGIALAVVGILGIMASPLAGVGILGAGLVMMAVGLVFLMLLVLIVGKLTPAIFKGIGWVVRKLTGKKKTA